MGNSWSSGRPGDAICMDGIDGKNLMGIIAMLTAMGTTNCPTANSPPSTPAVTWNRRFDSSDT